MAPSRWLGRQQRVIRRLPRAGPGPSQIWHGCLDASCHEAGKCCCKVPCPIWAVVRSVLRCSSLRLPHALQAQTLLSSHARSGRSRVHKMPDSKEECWKSSGSNVLIYTEDHMQHDFCASDSLQAPLSMPV